MDFLASYGSGSEDGGSDVDQRGGADEHPSTSSPLEGRISTAKTSHPAAIRPDFFDAPPASNASTVVHSVTAELLTGGAILDTSFSNSSTAATAPAVNEELLSQLLPPPSAAATRRLVAVQLPAHKALLASANLLKASEGEDAPAKRPKPNTGVKKSSLISLLPPPKNTPTVLGSGSGLDGMGRRGPASSGVDDGAAAATGLAGFAAAAAAVAARQQAAAVPQPLGGNEMYRASLDEEDAAEDMADPVYHPAAAFAVRPGIDSPADSDVHRYGHAPSSHQHHLPSEQHYDHQQQYHQQYQPSQQYQHAGGGSSQAHRGMVGSGAASGSGGGGGQRAAQAAVESDSVDALFEEAVRAEKEKANKRGRGKELPPEVQFMEIKQAELTFNDTSQQNASEGLRGALGAQYAAQQRAAAQEFEGNKMAKRKHQIGTLFYNAKMKELEMMEKRAQGTRKGQTTQAKYGF